MSWLKALCVLFRLWRWLSHGSVPTFSERRLLLMVLEKMDSPDARAAFDLVAGPAFLSIISDKRRRRRMAVYRVKSAMTVAEKMDAAIRAIDRLAAASHIKTR